jgi:hypothetical protein
MDGGNGLAPNDNREMTMTKSRNSDRNDQSALIDDAQLDAVVGGTQADDFSAFLASRSVGGWIMKDIWTKPTLGTYH